MSLENEFDRLKRRLLGKCREQMVKEDQMKKAYEILLEQCSGIDVPHHVWTKFGSQQKIITFAGDQVSLGEDFGDLQQIRSALEWYVDQFGGKVEWKDDRKKRNDLSRKSA
jgi:hypothetical protein